MTEPSLARMAGRARRLCSLRAAVTIVHLHLQVDLEHASLKEVLERILDGVIVFEPSVRLALPSIDLKSTETTITVAPERRNKPFVMPPRRESKWQPSQSLPDCGDRNPGE